MRICHRTLLILLLREQGETAKRSRRRRLTCIDPRDSLAKCLKEISIKDAMPHVRPLTSSRCHQEAGDNERQQDLFLHINLHGSQPPSLTFRYFAPEYIAWFRVSAWTACFGKRILLI